MTAKLPGPVQIRIGLYAGCSELAEYGAVLHSSSRYFIPHFNISPVPILPWNISPIKRRSIEAITSWMINGLKPEAVAAAETQRPIQAEILVSIQRQI